MILFETKDNNRLSRAHPDCDPLLKAIGMDYSLRMMFMPLVRKHFPLHYLLRRRNDRYQAYLDCCTQTHPYFLYFEIVRFYSTITHKSIGADLLCNFEELSGYAVPKNMQAHLLQGPDLWFADTPWSRNFHDDDDLLCIAAGAYLLGLCQGLSRWPFLCHHEKFVVLFSAEAEIEECLQQVHLELERLGLRLNPHTFCSGQAFPKGFTFVGQKEDNSAFARFEKEGEDSMLWNNWVQNFGDWV